MSGIKGFAFGVINSITAAIVGIIAVPFYLKYLGKEAYGVIAFFSTFQAILQIFDLGISPTTSREVARLTISQNFLGTSSTIKTLERLGFFVLLFTLILISMLSPQIASYWLKTTDLKQSLVANCIVLMSLIFGLRIVSSVYSGALIGLQRVDLTSKVSLVYSLLSTLGAILLLNWDIIDLSGFFIWQLLMTLSYLAALRIMTIQLGLLKKDGHFSKDILRSILKFSLGMNGISVASVVLMQLDKVILSNQLGLKEYGSYMIGVQVSNSLLLLVVPFFNVIFPNFSQLVSTNDPGLKDRFYWGTRTLLSVIFPTATILSLVASDLIYIWTHDQDIVQIAGLASSLLTLGIAVNTIMVPQYSVQLAKGDSPLALKISILMLFITAPMTFFLARHWGPTGGALSYLISNLIYVLLGTFITFTKYFEITILDYFKRALMWPLLTALALGLISHLVLSELGPMTRVLLGTVMGTLIVVINLYFDKNTRDFIVAKLHLLKKH